MKKFAIFTDGGGFPINDEKTKFDACSGYRLFNMTGEVPQLIHRSQKVTELATGQFAESEAIALGLENLQDYLQSTENVDTVHVSIITDSMLYYNSLTIWIYSWLRKMKEGVFYMSAGAPVKNQSNIKRAFKCMTDIRKTGAVKLFHLNSHIPKHKLKGLKKKFETFNKCKCSDEQFAFIHLQNSLVDQEVSAAYKEFKAKKSEILIVNDEK